MRIVVRMGTQLGVALASLANIMDISTFIIGGGISGFGAPLFDSTKATINNRVMESLRSRIKVIPAKLENEAGIKGASSLVFYKK